MEQEPKKLSRRDFLKVAVPGIGSLFTMVYAPWLLRACNTTARMAAPIDESDPAEPINTLRPTNTLSSPTLANTVTSHPEAMATQTATPDVWRIPSIEERKSLLATPDFFMKPQGGKIILAPQFADSEWERLTDKRYLLTCDYKGHGCGISVITELIRTMGFFQSGKVPDVTNADVVNFLVGKTHDGCIIISGNNIAMQDDQLKWGIDLLGQQTGMFSTVGLTPDWGLGNPHLVPTSEWSALFTAARETVLDKGGLVVARVLKYGRPAGSLGHFIIISSFNNGGEPLIVDSIGPWRDHKRQGDARTIGLGAYVERAQENVPIWGGQPGLLWMAGVVPTF